jgi:hypothetical protein
LKKKHERVHCFSYTHSEIEHTLEQNRLLNPEKEFVDSYKDWLVTLRILRW